jgi:predicted transcriptional regulator
MPKRAGHGIELLADVTRRRIIGRLAAHPYRPSVLANELGLARSTVSHHLRLLHEAGLIRILNVWNDARYRLYGIDPRAHGRITAWLAGTDVGVHGHTGDRDDS